RLQPVRVDEHARLPHLALEARERGLGLRGAAAALGGLVRLLDEQHLERGVRRLRHQADVPRLVELADLELAVAEDLAVALRPADRLLAGAHLELQRRRRQLVLAAVRPLPDRALPAAEGQAGAR